MAGLVVDLRLKKTKRGETLCFVTLDDRSARIDVTLFGEAYENARRMIAKDQVLVIEGEVANDDYNGGLKVRGQSVLSVAEARVRFAEKLVINCDANRLKPRELKQLSETLARFKPLQQGVVVELAYVCDAARGRLRLGENWAVLPQDELILALKEQFGNPAVQLEYAS
jgi:DNA polymerase-3 subunit alpha